MGVGDLIFKHSFIDMDYVYGTLSNSDGENPLDYAAFRDSTTEFIAIATDALTGEPKYFDKTDFHQDDYAVLKASCAIPSVCHPYEVGGRLYFDGALGDTIPIDLAYSMGCDKVVLLLTKPADTFRTSEKDEKLAKLVQRNYPLAAEKLRQRAQYYNEGVIKAKEYTKQGKLLIVAPNDACGVDTLKRDSSALRRLYAKGYQDGKAIWSFISGE